MIMSFYFNIEYLFQTEFTKLTGACFLCCFNVLFKLRISHFFSLNVEIKLEINNVFIVTSIYLSIIEKI